MARRLFLIGYMAAGKTTLGRWAARRLGYDFIDLDHYIESRYMKSVSDLFAERGEEGFREIERRMLHEVGEFDRVLISTGGGTPCFFDNMDYMLSQGLTVYLEASVPVLCRRLKCSHTKRPLVDSKTEEELATFIIVGRMQYSTPTNTNGARRCKKRPNGFHRYWRKMLRQNDTSRSFRMHVRSYG